MTTMTTEETKLHVEGDIEAPQEMEQPSAQPSASGLKTQAKFPMNDKLADPYAIRHLRVVCEMERHKHKLSARYLANRYFWMLFLPALALTTLSGALAFSSTSEIVNDGDRPRQGNVLTLAVGVISLVSAAIQALSDQLNWKGRALMHKSAAVDLRMLVDQLRFESIEMGRSYDMDDQAKKMALKIRQTAQDQYLQIMQGCKSTIPSRIDQAYGLMEPFIIQIAKENQQDEEDDYKDGHLDGHVNGVHTTFKPRWKQALNYLYFEMSRGFFVPPHPRVAFMTSMHFFEEYSKLDQDDKVIHFRPSYCDLLCFSRCCTAKLKITKKDEPKSERKKGWCC